eukprot:144381-Chlamydomonas_euryale.AAC.2
MDGDGLPGASDATGAAAAALEPFELPSECWMVVLSELPVREVCMMGRANRELRGLAGSAPLWASQYSRLFGQPPSPRLGGGAAVRRMCRRSEIRAARWLEADVTQQTVGFPDTACLQLDERKVVSGDGCAVRVWSHEAGKRYRRIATLQGHASHVACVAYDDNVVLSGDAGGMLRVWGMDDLKPARTVRAAHDGPGGVAGVGLLSGIPVSVGGDGCVRLWDVASGAAIMALEAPRSAAVAGLDVAPDTGRIATCGDGVHVWDAGVGGGGG